MSKQTMSACMKLVSKMDEQDQDMLLDRLAQYQKDGIPAERAQLMAASDTLAELENERKEFMAALREQHPDLFLVKPDIKRSSPRKDFTIETSNKGSTATAMVGSRLVGRAYAWEDSRGKFVIMNTEVREKYRRRGIARAMYEAIERETGKQLTPAVSLSDDAFEFWKSFRPEAVALDLRHWKDQLIGAPVVWKGLPGKIIKADGGTALMQYDEAQQNGTQSVILRRDLNGALEAAGSPTIDFDATSVKPSKQRDVTDTPAFKKWFDGSKVVDEDGKPMVVYHGTVVREDTDKVKGMGDIEAFDRMFTTKFRSPSLDTVGSWFSTNPGKDGAEMYTGGGSGAAIYPVYLSIKNPQVTTFQLMQRRARMLQNGKDDGRRIGQAEVDAYRKWLKEMGKDGIKIEGSGNDGSTEFDNQEAWIALEPNQIKSATGNNGQFDPANPDIRKSTARNELGFYSALAKSIEGMQTKAAPAGAWKTQIKGLVNKAAIKQDEVTWSGLEDWMDLQEGKITKEQITDYLKSNGVQVQEVTLGRAYDEQGNEIWDSGGETKYSQYTLPGGENYREVLLTLPTSMERTESARLNPDALRSQRNMLAERAEKDVTTIDEYIGYVERHGTLKEINKALQEDGREDLRSINQLLSMVRWSGENRRRPDYTSTHWDQENVLAHIRVNDRTDANGKRVLFVEEVQSDWGQEGKKRGFRRKLTEAQQERVNELNLITEERDFTDAEQAEYDSLRDGFSDNAGVPIAPFVTKTDGWLNLALKRVIAMAVDGGYDAVAFINGDQSAARYDLSKQVDQIRYKKNNDGTFDVWASDRYGAALNDTVDKQGLSPSQIEDFVGKEVAQKIVDDKGREEDGDMVLEGVDLKVGGEGMKAFYDKIVPNAVKALLKKMGGGQLEMVKVQQTQGFEGNARKAPAKAIASEQPGFTITDAMREKVSTEGLTLFSPARDMTDTPEFKAWFDGSQVVDEDGRPKVVYHNTGSSDNFSVFRTDRELGAHFGTVDQANERGPGIGRSTMPVYLSIKNPLRLEDKGDFHAGNVLLQLRRMGMITRSQAANMSSDVREIQRVIKGAGYDGVVYLNRREIPGVFGPDGIDGNELDEMSDRDVMEFFGDDAQDSWIAFRPEQIKSATGNRGTFDPSDADITRSPGRTATGAAWDSPSAEKFDDLVYKLQDKLVDTKRVVEAIKTASGAIADDLNVYLQEELYHGRAAKRTEDFVNMELNPLIEQMAKDGLKLEDVEEFMHARHAPEANKVIAQRNPGVQDLQDGGSGMETGVALNYMATLPADLKQKLEAAAAKVDAIIAKTRELYVDYELESRDTVDGWGRVFQHYIPLQREDKNGSPGLGQGFSVKGKETKGRTGSTRKVVDIMANIAMQREKAIVRGEKNRVSQALVGLATANPNEGFWQVDEVPTERVFNEKTGLVEDRVDPLYKSRENAVIAKIKGADGKVKEHAVLFNQDDARAMRMAAALKNLDAAKLEGLMGVSAMISRYFASINTSLNPVFGVVNALRDVQGVALNLSSTELKGEELKVLRNTTSALAGIYGDARRARKGQGANSKWAALWEEFQEVGGQTGFRDLFRTSEDRANAIKKTLDPDAWTETRLGKIFTAGGVLKVPMAQARRAAGWIFDIIEDYNLAMENGVRLAVYKAGIDKGLSKERAASIAKNASTNFNRKGQIGQQAGALYAFFNASVQGTARIGQTIFDMEPGKPKTIRLSSFGKKIVYGGMLLGSAQALALAAAGYNDEDPPDFVRERSLIFPVGGGKYVTIPMPLGFNVIPNIGRMATEFALSGFKNPEERAIKLISLFAEAYNPIGNAGLSMQTLAPTALDPFVALTENKDYTGKPIARTSSNEAIPGHALGRDTASSVSKFLSEAINTLSGGNKYVAGVFSPSPDQIEYLLGQLTGGVGRELSKIEQSTLATARGEALPTYKIPLVGRFVGDTKSQASEGAAFYANTERLNRLETEIKGLEKDGKRAEAAELRRSSSEAYLITVANQAERQIQRLRSEKRELVKAGAPREQVVAIEERITGVMARLNRAADALREKQEAN